MPRAWRTASARRRNGTSSGRSATLVPPATAAASTSGSGSRAKRSAGERAPDARLRPLGLLAPVLGGAADPIVIAIAIAIEDQRHQPDRESQRHEDAEGQRDVAIDAQGIGAEHPPAVNRERQDRGDHEQNSVSQRTPRRRRRLLRG